MRSTELTELRLNFTISDPFESIWPDSVVDGLPPSESAEDLELGPALLLPHNSLSKLSLSPSFSLLSFCRLHRLIFSSSTLPPDNNSCALEFLSSSEKIPSSLPPSSLPLDKLQHPSRGVD